MAPDLSDLRFRLVTPQWEFESSNLHDVINKIRREDPISYELSFCERSQTAPAARWFTLVRPQESRFRS